MCSSTVYLVPRFFTIVVKKLLNSSATFFIFREKEFCFELKYLDGGGVVVVLSVRKDFTVLQISLLSVIFFIFSLLYFCYFISFFRLLNLLLLILRYFLVTSSDLFATLSWCLIVRRGWLLFLLFFLNVIHALLRNLILKDPQSFITLFIFSFSLLLNWFLSKVR